MQNIIVERLILKGANLALTRDATMSTLFHDSFWQPVLRAPLRNREETSLSLSVLENVEICLNVEVRERFNLLWLSQKIMNILTSLLAVLCLVFDP
jgi:hypothetical protein